VKKTKLETEGVGRHMSKQKLPTDLIPVVDQLHTKLIEYGGTILEETSVPKFVDQKSLGSRDSSLVPLGHDVTLVYRITKGADKFQSDVESTLAATDRAAELDFPTQGSNFVITFLWIYKKS